MYMKINALLFGGKRKIAVFAFLMASISAWSQVIIDGAKGNGDFENISPSDAPIQSAIRRAANTNATFSIPGWTITQRAGYVGIDAAKGGYNGASYAFVNSSSEAVFISDTFNDVNLTKGEGLKLSFKASNDASGKLSFYVVTLIIDGEELKLPRQSVTIENANVFQAVEFNEQLWLDVNSVAIKIELINRGDGATGGQPRFDDLRLEVVPSSSYPPSTRKDRYYVATDGSDSNDGSLEHPFRTIQKAADAVKYGGTVEIREGVYREKVLIGNSGLSNAPITFQAYNNEKVVVSTCDLLSGWTAAPGDINQDGVPDSDVWQTTMDWDAGDNSSDYDQSRWSIPNDPSANNTMFVDGVLKYEAREKGENNPVYIDDWGIIPHGALKNEGFTAPELAGWPDDFWNGAKIYHHTSDWSGNYSVIGDYASNGKVTFKDPLTYFPSQKQRFGYIILGTIKAMDKPHEWYKELGNNTIYYKASPGVNPNDLEIEMKKRDFTFDLQGAGNIIIKNIIHRGGGPVSFTPCKNFTFQENEVYGLSENGYGHMRIYGDNVQIKDNIFRQSYKSVMLVGGDRWDIVNNKFEDISYRIDDTGLEIDNTSSRFLISYNTFSGLGRGAFRFYPLKSVISYNIFERFCRNSFDTGAIDGDQSRGQGGGSLVHHNIFRDAPQYNKYQRGEGTNGSAFAGLYSGLELTVYRNIFLNVGAEPIVNCRLNSHNFYHNTFAGYEPRVDISSSVESSYLNNLQVNVDHVVTPNLKIDGNVNFTATDFEDLDAGNVRLSAQSSAIDKGVLIPGINDNYVGAAPDAGALEYGEPVWKSGCDFDNPPVVTYNYAPPAGANILGDGAFTNASDWNFIKNSSLYNPNAWNHGALGHHGAYSLQLLADGLIEGEFDNLQPNKTYELGVEARLVYPAIRADQYSSLQGTASVGNHRAENYLTELDQGEAAAYANIDFGDGTIYDHAEVSFARATSLTPEQGTQNTLELRLGSSSGTLLATLQYRSGVADSWSMASSEMNTSPSGVQTVYLVPRGNESGSMRICAVRFFKKGIDANKQLIAGVENHGFGREINFVGKGDWPDRYEKMLFHTGNEVGTVKVFFKNDGPYEAYVSRAYLKEVGDYHNIAPLATSVQSSTQNGSPATNANDGKRDQDAAVTNQETAPFWQMELNDAKELKALRISSANNENTLQNIRVSLGNNDPRLGGIPLLSRDYKLTGEDLAEGKSLYVCVYEWIKDILSTNTIPSVNFVRVERLDGKKLALSEVEAISYDTDVDEFAQSIKDENQWQYTFAYDINPTKLIVVNSDTNELENMRVTVRDSTGIIVWEKLYDGNYFNLPKNGSFDIPGNELSADGNTRLASVLGRTISVEKVGSDLYLKDFKVFDGSQVAPEGNLALQGKATQIGNYYRDHGFAGDAVNGYIFPNSDFTTSTNTSNPWWELELAQSCDIDQIVLWNRNPEAVANRIGKFKVSVLNDSKSEIWSQNYSYSSGDLANGKSLVINTDHNNARYVRVQCSSSSTFLHLAEVQVWPKDEESHVRTLPQQDIYRFDLGPVNQQVQSGWTAINPTTTGDVWWSNRPESVDRGAATNDLNRDFASATSPTSLNVRIPNGQWRVTITTGDAESPRSGLHVVAENEVLADNISTEANSFATFSKNVTVDDGVLNISVSDLSNGDLTWVLNSLTIDSDITAVNSLNENNNDILLYPNPAKERVFIRFSDISSAERVELINTYGQVVKQFPVTAALDSYPLSGLRSGIYMVRVCVDNQMVTKKIIKTE